MKNIYSFFFQAAVFSALMINVISTQAEENRYIESWITRPDRSALFQKQADRIYFNRGSNPGFAIIVDDRQAFQTMDGFGFALTWGSAMHLQNMSAEARAKILKECFGRDENSAGFSYIRLSLGACDLNSFVYSYNDLPEGETDFELKKFDLGHDHDCVLPMLKEVLAINPNIKIMSSPWSAPAWMKTNGKVRGGSLKKECYDAYALYFVKYIQAMAKEGITIDAVTIQNEPLNSRNTPSMEMRDLDQQLFIKKHLGPLFKKNGITTKIVLFDHNCDRPDYPLNVLSDPEAAQYVNGSGFHHYGGDISAMSLVHQARPDKDLYFTEQMVIERPGIQTIAIAEQVKRLIIGCSRNWSKNVILWNLAADKNNDPHTDNGGCPICQGALTLEGDQVTRNLAYYVIAHASKLVPPGSVRIASTSPYDTTINITSDEERNEVKRATVIEHSNVLPNVAFKTPDGKIVLIVANDSWISGGSRIQYQGQSANFRLPPGAVGTYVWPAE